MIVDGKFLKKQMKIEVKKSGRDNKTFKESNKWLRYFTKRRGISKQKKTKKKSISLIERLPQIRNFHCYISYQMTTEDP